MTLVEQSYRLGEFHPFEAEGEKFLYLVPAGAIFQVDEAVQKIISCVDQNATPHEELIGRLVASGMTSQDAEELVM
jgi:uncharacterized protein